MNDIFTIIESIETSSFKIILEVGAADGADSQRIIDSFKMKNGLYYAFEPDPANYQALRKCSASELPFFHTINSAIGDKTRTDKFNRSSGINPNLGCDHTFSGSLKKPVEHLAVHPWCKFDEEIYVNVMSLDDFAHLFQIQTVDFIWCDVQGAEDLVISGAYKTLKNTRYFYTEFYDNEMYEGQLSCNQILNMLGKEWNIVEKWEDNVLFERK